MKKLFYLFALALISSTVFAQNIINGIAGTGAPGYSGDGGTATSAMLNFPTKVVADAIGNIYFADNTNNAIRKIDVNGIITTIAGNGTAGYSGDGGLATAAIINYPWGVAVDGVNNIYFCDGGNHVIRKIDAITGIITTVAGTGVAGFSGDGGPATAATLNLPTGLAIDGAGNIYVTDDNNNRVRKVENSSGIITTFAGTGIDGFSGDGSLASSAQLSFPVGISVDIYGNVYLADALNSRIRKVNTAGIINTIAGNGGAGYSGDGGLATSATLYFPWDAVADSAGNIFIADFYNYCIRKVDGGTGIISTYAGTPGVYGFSGDGGLATVAKMNAPTGVCLDNNNNLIIADGYNNVLRKVSAPLLLGGISMAVPGCSSYPSTDVSGGICGGSTPYAECSFTVCAGTTIQNAYIFIDVNTTGAYPFNQTFSISGASVVSVVSYNPPYYYFNLTFNAPGTYTLQGSFSGGNTIGCQPPEEPGVPAPCWLYECTNYVVVTVLQNPLNPVLNVSPNPACAGAPVCFTFGNNQPNPGTYTFTTGAGATYTNTTPSPNPTFCGTNSLCYPNNGTFNATLTYGNANGCKATITTPVVVNPIQANPSFTQPGNCDVFNFVANPSTCVLSSATYFWTFGDGGTSTSQNPQHVYATSGPFNVTLTITSGCASATFNLLVNSNQNCCANTPPAGTGSLYPRTSVAVNAGTTLYLGTGGGSTIIYNNTDYTAYAGSTIQISSPTSWNGFSGVLFTGCTFLMYPGSKIVLYTNHTNTISFTETSTLTVTFDRCHLYGCSQLWEGIRFEPTFPPSPQCGIDVVDLQFTTNLFINETLLEDAYHGVGNSNALKPKIVITTSIFNKNKTDLFLDQNRLNSGSYSKNTVYTCRHLTYNPPFIPVPTFNNATNYYNTKLLPVSVASVKPSSVLWHNLTTKPTGDTVVKLFSSGPPNASIPQVFNLSTDQNIYDRHIYGIDGDLINMVIGKQFFYNLNNGVFSNGVQFGTGTYPILNIGHDAASSNSFKDCVTGIFTRYKTQQLIASSNVFTGTAPNNFKVGIQVNDFNSGGSCIIKNNQIKNAKLNAIVFNLNVSINALVQNNFINYISTFKNFFSKGILVNENGNPSTALYNIDGNGIYFTYTGIECLNTAGTLITNNNIQINTPSVFSGLYNYGINNINCNTNSIGDNTITGDNVQAHNWQFGINSVNHPGQNIYCNIIKGTSTGLNLQGPSMTNVNFPIRNNDLTGELIDVWMLNACVVGQQVNAGNLPIDNTFHHSTTTYTNSFCSAHTQGSSSPFYIKTGLFDMTKNYWDLNAPGTPMTPVHVSGSSPQSCNTGGGSHRMINLAKQIALDSVFPATDLRNTFESHRHLYNNLISENINTSGDAVLANFKNTHASGNIGKLFTIEQNISDGIKNNNPTLIMQAGQMNNNLAPANGFEALHKQVNTAYINYLNSGFIYNTTDLSILRQIAMLCPFTDGAAVWQARSLLVGIDSISYFNSCEIIPLPVVSGQRFANAENVEMLNNSVDILVYPNPNKGTFTINYNLKTDAIFTLLDVTGKEIYTYKLIADKTELNITENNLSEGMYLFKITSAGTVIQNGRLAIIK